jgi:histidinol dehydrogenase
MKLIRTSGKSEKQAEQLLRHLEQRGAIDTARVEPAVRRIVARVRRGGDKALRAHAHRLDGLSSQSQLQISQAEMQNALASLSPQVRDALETAAANIRVFAEQQMPHDFTVEVAAGVQAGQRVRPLSAVGCYVPSGRYPLPSTLLMTVIPAQVAGVQRIVVVSPKPAKETLAAAALLGVEHFYRVGGAQAIAALAYGTETIARVDKVVGPGNIYVTTAKKLVAFDCAIDMLAGPTEIIVATESGNATWLASDIVAQAEHDPQALAIVATSNAELANEIVVQVRRQSKKNSVARESLSKHGYVFLAASATESRAITNRLAGEHLTVDAYSDIEWVMNAGSVFIGADTPQSMGDYITGPNHVLPTGSAAHSRGGLSVFDFVKLITAQQYSPGGLARLGPKAAVLAEAEGLVAHAASIRMRLDQANGIRGARN